MKVDLIDFVIALCSSFKTIYIYLRPYSLKNNV
jgi:hypothetical protein